MINIKSADFLPGLYKPFKEGQLTEEHPYQFKNGAYEENLTRPEWERLKKFAVGAKKSASENGTSEKGGVLPSGNNNAELEDLKAKYAALPTNAKNAKEGRELRAKIKELENK